MFWEKSDSSSKRLEGTFFVEGDDRSVAVYKDGTGIGSLGSLGEIAEDRKAVGEIVIGGDTRCHSAQTLMQGGIKCQ